MTDNHNYAFWGQSTGMTLESNAKEDPFIFLKCIKKKSDGSWEKFKQGEGKAIRISLEEIIMILQVLKKNLRNWATYHSYKDEKTQISFGWETGRDDILWINIGDYSKKLNLPQIELLRMLLEHILEEKIRDATISTKEGKNGVQKISETVLAKMNNEKVSIDESLGNYNKFKEQTASMNALSTNNNSSSTTSKDKTNVQGTIKGETKKALLIAFISGREQWVPKSKIHSDYNAEKSISQTFLIENWILKKAGII